MSILTNFSQASIFPLIVFVGIHVVELLVCYLHRIQVLLKLINSLDESGDVDRHYGMDIWQGSCHFTNLFKDNMVHDIEMNKEARESDVIDHQI